MKVDGFQFPNHRSLVKWDTCEVLSIPSFSPSGYCGWPNELLSPAGWPGPWFWWREQPKKGRWVWGRHHAKLHWNYAIFSRLCILEFLWCLWETQGILGHVHSDQSTQPTPMNDSESFKLGNPARRWTGFSVHGFMAIVNWPGSYFVCERAAKSAHWHLWSSGFCATNSIASLKGIANNSCCINMCVVVELPVSIPDKLDIMSTWRNFCLEKPILGLPGWFSMFFLILDEAADLQRTQ